MRIHDVGLWIATFASLIGCATGHGVSGVSAGRPVLYQSQQRGGTEDLWAYDLATGTSTRLLAGDSVSSRSVAAWDRDAARIAYVREHGNRDELFVFNPRTKSDLRIGATLPSAVMFPDWSPDGRTVAVSSGTSAEFPGIYFVDTKTDAVRAVRSDGDSYRCPSWAPSGDRLVVAAHRNGKSALIVFTIDGIVRDTLMQSDSTYLDCPQWSPSGSEVLFNVFHGSGESVWKRPALHSNLAVLSLDTRRVRFLTRDKGLTNYGRWSADGEWVVFQSDRASMPAKDAADAGRMLQALEIYLIRRDGSGIRRLTQNAYFDAHPSW